MHLRLALSLLACLAFAACGDKAEKGKTPEPGTPGDAGHEDHDHDKGPHGGVIVELGEEEAHLEVVHDEAAGTVLLHVMDKAMKDLVIAGAPALNLVVEGKPKQLVGTAVGGGASGSSAWKFEDAALKGEPEGARFRVVVAGKTFTPDFAHAH